ncbi:MAG TPA: MFS transporter [Dehalococcoidia bacterium]|nr:MFS transporter [Dehalococcoidia bacterium]
MQSANETGSLRTALRRPDYRYLASGLTISGIGDWLYSVALLVWVFNETDSAVLVGVASIFRILPTALFGAFAGEFAGRYNRRLVMVGSDLSRAVCMFGLAVIAGLSGPVGLGLAVVFLSTTLGTPYFPAVQATVPSLVREDELAPANALISSIETVSIVVGPAIGGLLLALGSEEPAFIINGFTFILSAALVSRIRSTEVAKVEQVEEPLFRRLGEGISAIRRSSDVSLLISIEFVNTITWGALFVLLVLVAEDLLGTGDAGTAFLYAALGLGGVGGAFFASRAAEYPRLGWTILAACVGFGLPLALLSLVEQPGIAYPLVATSGVAVIVLVVTTNTMLQRLLPLHLMARVFGVVDSLDVTGMLIGSLSVSLLVDLFGLEAALVIAGLIPPLAALALLPRLRGLNEASAIRARQLAPIVNRLANLTLFSGLSRTSLEAVASCATEETVTAGTAVIRQGDPPDDLFVVRSGELEAVTLTASGETEAVGRIKEGDYFGEIGLLHSVPRTASVTAVTETVVYRICGPDFLAAITQAPAAQTLLHEGISARLSAWRPELRPAIPKAGESS